MNRIRHIAKAIETETGEKHLALLFGAFRHRIHDLFRRAMQSLGLRSGETRQPAAASSRTLPLCGARSRDIVTRDGLIIATIVEEITQRLNDKEWKRQEDQWVL